MRRFRSWTFAAFLLILVAGVWWAGREPAEETPALLPSGPDLVLDDFHMDRFTPAGLLERRLEGRRYRAYRSQALGEVEAPRLWVVRGDGWRAEGERATVIDDDFLVIQGAVEVRRHGRDGDWSLHTPVLRVWSARHYLEGDGPVHLLAPWGQIRGGSLSAHWDKGEWSLAGGVSALYREGQG